MPDIYDVDEGRPEPFIGPPAPGDRSSFARRIIDDASRRGRDEARPYKPPDVFGALGRFGRGAVKGVFGSEIVQNKRMICAVFIQDYRFTLIHIKSTLEL